MAASPARRVRLGPGARIDRYVVVHPIAHGGMGSVLLAFDTELGREVAIKVLLTASESDEARARMLREAQAMAQLSHPNVAAVYAVGTHDGDIFIAMEHVDGQPMNAWLRAAPSVAAIVDVVQQAGWGLAAAHAGGIVHRDLKPSNVIVGKDGRARVVDFGVARAVSGAPEPRGDDAPLDVDPGPGATGPTARFSEALTAAGTAMGTVGFMAPEQLAGRDVDARADVFALGVTLWRALFGAMPFATDTPAAYRAAVRAGPTRGPLAARVPRWLEAVARRAVAYDRDDRFPTMAAVIRALGADPRPRRLAALAAGVALCLAVVAVIVSHARRASALASCAAEGRAVEGSWSEPRRRDVREAMTADGQPFGDDRAARVTAALDRFAAAWNAERRAACEATRVTGAQTGATLQARAQCLEEGRQALDAATGLLASADPQAHRHALALAQGLPPPTLCTGRLAERAMLPADPAAHAIAGRGRQEAAHASALSEAGRSRDALAAFERAAADARASSDASGEAQALRLGGGQLQQMGETDAAVRHLLDAYVVTERIGDDRQGGLCAARLASILSASDARGGTAAAWLDLARAKLARIGDDAVLDQSVLFTQALLYGRDPATVGRAYALWGELADKSRAVYGPSSRACAALTNRGVAAWMTADVARALGDTRAAITCEEDLNGAHGAGLAINYANAAEMLVGLDRFDEALAAARHASELRREADPASPGLVTTLALEASALAGLGRLDEAEGVARAAVAAGGDKGGGDAPRALTTLGTVRARRGDAAGARGACARAVALDDAAGRPRPDELYETDALTCAGEAALALGDVAAARAWLERSASAVHRPYAGDLALARLALARALRAEGPAAAPDPAARARAAALAAQAASDLGAAVATRPSLAPRLAEAQAWSP